MISFLFMFELILFKITYKNSLMCFTNLVFEFNRRFWPLSWWFIISLRKIQRWIIFITFSIIVNMSAEKVAFICARNYWISSCIAERGLNSRKLKGTYSRIVDYWRVLKAETSLSVGITLGRINIYLARRKA